MGSVQTYDAQSVPHLCSISSVGWCVFSAEGRSEAPSVNIYIWASVAHLIAKLTRSG